MIAAREMRYLGDAVYVAHDGYHIVLTTEDGIRRTNTIYLEPEVWAALQRTVAVWNAEHGQAIDKAREDRPTFDGPR